MAAELPSLSTDQVMAFVELARQGSLRRASEVLLITEQGVRNRLLTLEQRLKVELYRKRQGPRATTPLTQAGRRFLPHAIDFLKRAGEMCDLFSTSDRPRDIHVAASQYLVRYVLIDAVRRFHAAFPHSRVRLSTHSEQEIETVLLNEPEIALGVAAPYDPSPELDYRHMFAMPWSLIVPPRHPLAARRRVRLRQLGGEPLVLFERGSTGRQHILDAFHQQGLSPYVSMETTTTEIVVRMVEAGLGVAIVPLLPTGIVTRGCRVAVRDVVDPIRPINSGILTRRGETLSAAAREFVDYIQGAGAVVPASSRRQR